MSTRPEFVQYLLDQLEGLGELRARKMFGDYLIYLNDRPALLVCDGTPFAKPLPCVAELLEDRPTAPPYEGAKAHYVLDPEGVADVINSSCNPYRQDVDADDLNIVY